MPLLSPFLFRFSSATVCGGPWLSKQNSCLGRVQNCEEQLLDSLCPSFRPSTRNNLAPTGRIFMKFSIWVFFGNCRENSLFIIIWQEWELYMKTSKHLWSRLPQFSLEWDISDKSFRENKNTHFMFKNFFFRKSCRLWYNVEKTYYRARQATDDNMAHAHFMLDTKTINTLGICHTYWPTIIKLFVSVKHNSTLFYYFNYKFRPLDIISHQSVRHTPTLPNTPAKRTVAPLSY